MKCLKLELLNKLEAKGKFVNLNPLTKQQRKSLDIRKSLMITLDKSKAIRYTNHESKGGTHKSPIEHERIGHWRTYKSGKQTWVNGMTVNKGKGGRVNKDYKI